MSRLIDADALKNAHNMGDECDKCETKWKECQYDYIYSKMDFCTWIDDAPTVDAVDVVHGYWEVVDQEEPRRYGCSVCKRLSFYVTNYCPNCGAKMDGEEKDNG